MTQPKPGEVWVDRMRILNGARVEFTVNIPVSSLSILNRQQTQALMRGIGEIVAAMDVKSFRRESAVQEEPKS